MAQKVSRNRVAGDRLWDDAGQVWTTTLGQWLTAQEVADILTRDGRAVVATFEGPMLWLSPTQAQAWWVGSRAHLEVPGRSAGVPDADGFTYRARRYTREGRHLLSFHGSC